MTASMDNDASTLCTLPAVRGMGTQLFDPIWAEEEHASTRCELLHVIQGTVRLWIGPACYQAGPGDILFVPANTAHRDEFDISEGLRVFLAFFDWQGAEAFFQRAPNELRQQMPARRKREIGALLEGLQHDVLGDTLADRLVVGSRLHTILLLILREAPVEVEGATPERGSARHRRRRALMLAAKSYLDAHYSEPVTLEGIAEALDVSAFYLSHVFSQESDFSLFSYLTTCRMEKARALLEAGRLNVSEVARAVGYENANYFAKVFRKHFHKPPSEMLGTERYTHDRT